MTDGFQVEGIEIIHAVDQKIEKVRTRSLDLSFNELLDMHQNGELIINPDYQRLFRWSEGSQSRFIESLILEMPIPPIFVIERDEGKYELIDGLQRISSYLHFRGYHPKAEDDDESPRFLTLIDCDIVKELNGFTYDTLPPALQIKLKRNFIRVEVIRKESDQRLRYYMFKRLNTGGEILSPQEIRNCTIRLLNNTFNEFIIELSQNADFVECISNLTDEKKDQKYDQELVLRFFAFKNCRDRYSHDVGDFMTEYMEAVSDSERDDVSFDYAEERRVFEKTFRVLGETLGRHAFSRVNDRGKSVSTFLSYHYEAFALGIQEHLERIDLSDEQTVERIRDAFRSIKKDPEFIGLTTGGGKNYANPLRARIEFVGKRIGSVL